MKKVLVTGANGFLGAHLSGYLSDHHYRVFAAARVKKAVLHSRAAALDITNQARVNHFIKENRPDYICHLAGVSIPRISWENPDETFRVNVGGTLNLLESVRRFCPSSRFLFMSSAQVYGRNFQLNRSANEKTPIWPENPYAFSKAAAELACFEYAKKYGLHTVVVRALNIVGAGARADLAFSEWCAQIAKAEKLGSERGISVGNLKLKRDFLHVDDAVRAMELMMRKGIRGEIYNLGSGQTRPLNAYMKFLMKNSKVRVFPESTPTLFRATDPQTVRINVNKLRCLGWKPQKSAFTALKELLDEYRVSR